jgi:hypothetical protein
VVLDPDGVQDPGVPSVTLPPLGVELLSLEWQDRC